MTLERQQLEAAIAELESRRTILGASIVDAAIAPLRERLRCLQAAAGENASPGQQPQALKQVSILFLDVVGSTAMSGRLDPEDVHASMDDALAKCTAIVLAHRGRVLNYAGDSLLAVFGAEEVREDDAERAVLAGLDLIEESKRQQALIRQRFGQAGFAVRVGIHTGAVLLGGGIDGDNNVRGFAVNVAARMEQSAPAGALRISHATYAQVRGVFDLTRQAPIEVKGVAEPMLTYLVQRRKPRAFRVASRGVEGVETRMVGRDAELKQLQSAYLRLHQQQCLITLTVAADAGLGKSRLLYEFLNWADSMPEPFLLFCGRARPSTQSQPYGLLRDILAWRLQIADSDSMQTAREKFEQGITPLFLNDHSASLAQAHSHLLGHLIGIDFSASKHIVGIQRDSEQIRNRGFHAAAQLVRRLTLLHHKPAVVLLDDLHWADEGSIEFLSYFLQVNHDAPILVIGLTRPVLFERHPQWLRSTNIERLELTALDAPSSRSLALELLQRMPEVPAHLLELITGSADGNPFYMEELLKMLVDDGAILTNGEHWQLKTDRLDRLHVPTTLTGVLQARLDGLQIGEKLALQQASVIGHVFWDQALAAIDPQALVLLPVLSRRDLVLGQTHSELDGVREFAFKHQLLHQVTLATVLKPVRRQAHRAVAHWLSGLTGARANDFLAVTAEHFEQGGEVLQAAEFFARAGEYACARHAHAQALRYVEQALALSERAPASDGPEQHRLRWRLLDVRERTLDLQGQRKSQQAALVALQALADVLDSDRLRADTAWRRSTLAMRTGDYPAMENDARQTIALAEAANDATLVLRGQHRLALAMTYLGASARGKALAQKGLERAHRLGQHAIEALFFNALSVIADMLGERLVSLQMDEQDLALNRALGNRRYQAIALVNLGSGWLRLGAHDRARQYLQDGLQLAYAVGDRITQANTLTHLSTLALRSGEQQLALTHASNALDAAVAVKSPEVQAVAWWALGNAELARGAYSDAVVAFEGSHAVALAIGSATAHDASTGLARAWLAQGQLLPAQQAVAGLHQMLNYDEALEGTEAPYLIWLTCYRVLAATDDATAKALLQTAHDKLQAEAAMLDPVALRQSFLNDVFEHRAIVTAWAAAQKKPEAETAARNAKA